MEAKERPILFSGPMVRAILDGRKTQTRRAVKRPVWAHPADNGEDFSSDSPAFCHRNTGCLVDYLCPYGQPGDRLWVRETFCLVEPNGEPMPPGGQLVEVGCGKVAEAWYRADVELGIRGVMSGLAWRPSIHMPRWASRITLEITGVRVERLQEISEADARAEGCEVRQRMLGQGEESPRFVFQSLWGTLNTKPPFRWEDNPWVWVVEFKRVDHPKTW